jgi:GT2 family glycosyltransferase
MSHEFTVVVPTIRQGLPGFKETIADIEASFTRPTEFHVLDGRGGKVAALNRAFDQVLLLTETPIYVTLDDDFVPPTGWQDKVALALEEFSHVGVVCPWPGNEQVWIDYVGAESVYPWKTKNGLRYRLLRPWRHIPGCLLAFRRATVIEIGKMPESQRKYDIYEDCWRGRMAYKLGWRSMYVEAGACRQVYYQDRDEYIAHKADAIDESRAQAQDVLKEHGIGDPLSWRFRRWLAKRTGRAKTPPNTTREIKESREKEG